MTHDQRLEDMLAALRAHMADLRPEHMEQTMHVAGLLRKVFPDPAVREEVRGYLKVLGRQYRDWRRAGLL